MRKKQDYVETDKSRFEQIDSGYNSASCSPPVNGQKESSSISQDDVYEEQYYSQNNFVNPENSKYDDSDSNRKDDDFDQDGIRQNGSYSKYYKRICTRINSFLCRCLNLNI